MESFNSMVLTLCLVALLAAMARVVWGRPPEVPLDQRVGTQHARFSMGLYSLFALILIATPTISFVLVTDLRIFPRGLGILMFSAAGVFLSLFLPLLLARLGGRSRLEAFLCHLEMRSRFNRKTLMLIWLSVTAFVLAIRLAVSIVS